MRRPSTRDGRIHEVRRDRGSISASARLGRDGSRPPSAATAASSRARPGNNRARASRFSRRRVSTASVARSRRQPVILVGRQPSRRAAPQASRSYQFSDRSIAPRSRSSVFTSITRRPPLAGCHARTSIHPRDRPSPISTSVATCQPNRSRRRATWVVQVAWTRSRCRELAKNGSGGVQDEPRAHRAKELLDRAKGHIGATAAFDQRDEGLVDRCLRSEGPLGPPERQPEVLDHGSRVLVYRRHRRIERGRPYLALTRRGWVARVPRDERCSSDPERASVAGDRFRP